ncbi:MAG: hypothetical protein M1536_06030, partial [Firmicutes bacterium]|nr:hypothetical protein [Bacillota bacterium]
MVAKPTKIRTDDLASGIEYLLIKKPLMTAAVVVFLVIAAFFISRFLYPSPAESIITAINFSGEVLFASKDNGEWQSFSGLDFKQGDTLKSEKGNVKISFGDSNIELGESGELSLVRDPARTSRGINLGKWFLKNGTLKVMHVSPMEDSLFTFMTVDGGIIPMNGEFEITRDEDGTEIKVLKGDAVAVTDKGSR